MAIVLKISCQGQLRRVPFATMPDFADVVSALEGSLPTCQAYAAKYTDDEGDLCSLVEPTFADFLTMAKVTSSGQSVFHVEVLPLLDATPTIATRPTLSSSKSGMRRHERPRQLEDVWEDDMRDLDELLQQFEEPTTSKKTSKKRKKKLKNLLVSEESGVEASVDQHEEEMEEEEGTSTDATLWATQPKVLTANAQQVAVTLEDYVETPAKEIEIQVEKLASGRDQCVPNENEETMYETEAGEYETDGEGSWEMDRVHGLRAPQYEDAPEEMTGVTLQRASSCPCLSTWQASQMQSGEQEPVSLIAQAWPFVDPNKVSVNFGQFQTQSGGDTGKISTDADSQLAFPALPEQTPPNSPAPYMYGYPQVVWMPVLINWAATEYACALPGEGPPIPLGVGVEAGA